METMTTIHQLSRVAHRGVDISALGTFLLCKATLAAAGAPWLHVVNTTTDDQDLRIYFLYVWRPESAVMVLGVYPMQLKHKACTLSTDVIKLAIRDFAQSLPKDTIMSTHILRRWVHTNNVTIHAHVLCS